MESAFTNQTFKIAVPKGRIFKQVLNAFEKSGYPLEGESDRSLVFINPSLGVALIPLKSDDVLTFVDQSLCDAGILGLDILMENGQERLIYRSLSMGQCRLAIAGQPMETISERRFIRVASKYPNLAQDFIRKLGMAGEVISMKSSVEVAPLLGMADCILDIIETGSTLKANGLEEWFPLFDITSKLIMPYRHLNSFPADIERILDDIIN